MNKVDSIDLFDFEEEESMRPLGRPLQRSGIEGSDAKADLNEAASTHRSLIRSTLLVLLALAGFAASAGADLPVRHWISAHVHDTEFTDWGRMLRSGGYLPTWLLASAAIVSVDRGAIGRWGWAALRRGMTLLLAVTLAGIADEGLKILFRRERPSLSGGHWYVFRPILERPFISAGLSLPSSHAAVAFAAAFALAHLIRPAAWVWILFAIGVGTSRVLTGAHHVSDVYVAALVGFFAAKLAKRIVGSGAVAVRRSPV